MPQINQANTPLEKCDCLNDCGDDSRIARGIVAKCAEYDLHRRPAEPADDLPFDVVVGGNTFRKGVSLRTFITAAQGWHKAAYPDSYTLTTDEKAENLDRLLAAAQPAEVQQVRDVLDVYHAALDDRLHAGSAAGRAIHAIEQALGMPWIQGASLKPTSSDGSNS